jgi:hypothetical protein
MTAWALLTRVVSLKAQLRELHKARSDYWRERPPHRSAFTED